MSIVCIKKKPKSVLESSRSNTWHSRLQDIHVGLHCKGSDCAQRGWVKRRQQGADLNQRLPAIFLQNPDAVQEVQEEVPAGGGDMAVHNAHQPAESQHLDIVLEHAGASQQSAHRPCTMFAMKHFSYNLNSSTDKSKFDLEMQSIKQ